MSRTRTPTRNQTPEQAPSNSSNAGESNTSTATPAAEQCATPESRAEPSDRAPRAGKGSPGLKSIEATQAIAKTAQNHDGPPPPSTPLEIASSELWTELLILDFAAYEARVGLAGLFACQDPIHRTMYKSGPEAYERDIEAYTKECQRSTTEIEQWRALLNRHAIPIGSLSLLREICAEAYDALSIIDKWERKRKKEPQWNWAYRRDVVDPFFGVRMPAPPVVDYDASKLIGGLYDIVRELAAGRRRPTRPAGANVSDALAAFDAIIVWSDDLIAADGVVSLKDIESVCMPLKAKTIRNKLSKNRRDNPPSPIAKGRGRARSQYRYSELREWLLRQFPRQASSLPTSFSEVAKILQNVQSGRQGT